MADTLIVLGMAGILFLLAQYEPRRCKLLVIKSHRITLALRRNKS